MLGGTQSMPTDLEPEAEQPLAVVTVTPSETEPVLPAVKTMELVP